jgi:hypothetical protein
MNAFFSFLHGYAVKKQVRIFALFFTLLLSLFSFFACAKPVDYFSYVSELRNNLFFAQTDGYSLRVFSVMKASPYIADGIKQETSWRTEIYLTAPSGDKEYTLSFAANGKTQSGSMSFDNVKGEYYYFCSLDISALSQLDFTVTCGETSLTFCAQSVKTEQTLSPESILNAVTSSEQELFSSLTDKYGFAGEIYLRLIYEDAPYYYVGVIERNGNVTAFLLNGETGKILAKRQA